MSFSLMPSSTAGVDTWALTSIAQPRAKANNLLVAADAASQPIWRLYLVWPTSKRATTITSAALPAGTYVSATQSSASSATLHWSNVTLAAPTGIHAVSPPSTCNVSLTLDGSAAAGTVDWTLSVSHSDASAQVGLWDVLLAVPGVDVGTNGGTGSAFFPAGFGVEYPDPLSTVPTSGVSGDYPSSSATMPFLVAQASAGAPGVYVAAHDETMCSKLPSITPFQALAAADDDSHGSHGRTRRHLPTLPMFPAGPPELAVTNPRARGAVGTSRTAPSLLDASHEHLWTVAPERHLGVAGKHNASLAPVADTPDLALHTTAAGGSVTLAISAAPENAGLSWAAYASPFGFTVGVTSPSVASKARGRHGAGDKATATATPGWFEASQIYRQWALRHAPWTKAGPVSERADMPAWWLANNLWVNSGWQCADIFNDTQGDPATVQARVSAIAKRFNISSDKCASSGGPGQSPTCGMALHHYEWQQGPNPDPSARYKFDTHYPDYDPARPGMAAAVSAMAAAGVKTFPYVNGRIFDVASVSYTTENGADYCVRTATPTFGASDLSLPIETYGSGATFHVADPTLPYWRDKYEATASYLVKECGIQGLYLDQLGAARPVADWTRNHSHALGGGGWWSQGLNSLVSGVYESATAAAGGGAANAVPMVTESNGETIMASISGYLTLVAFDPPFAGTANKRLAPAFPAVYGGMYVAFGDIFSQADFADGADALAARMATQLVYGAQIGWFSLGGITHGPHLDHNCGPMGTFDLFMSAEHDAEVAYLQALVGLRSRLALYVVHGRLQQPVALSPPAPVFLYNGTQKVRNPGPFTSVATGVWRSDAANTVAVIVAGTTRAAYTGSTTLDMLSYGFPNAATQSFTATRIDPSGERTPLGTYQGALVPVSLTVAGRSAFAVEIAVA